MSVAHTADAVIARRKTVTRRAGWVFLTPGTQLDLCRKVMGRRHGEPLERLARVEVVDVRREQLNMVTDEDVALEGFTDDDWSRHPWAHGMTWLGSPAEWFIRFFTDRMGGTDDQHVTRIEWRYLDGET